MIVSFLFWFLLCFNCYVDTCCTSNSTGRIMEGQPANITDFPYQLALEVFNGTIFPHNCGASIIHPSWAITAAHCILSYTKEQIRLRSGSNHIKLGGTLHSVAKIIIHPKYYSNKRARHDYDVSILKVSTPFSYSEVTREIPMANKTPSPGTRAVVSGWGYVNYELLAPAQLQKLSLYIMDHDECKRTNFYLFHRLTPRMLCANVSEGAKNIYLGDSGAPLVVRNTLVGIVSFMIGYRRVTRYENFPSVYTDVAKIRPWVTSTINKNQ